MAWLEPVSPGDGPLSIVFNARKHAEHSKQAREAAVTEKPPRDEVLPDDPAANRVTAGRIARSNGAWVRAVDGDVGRQAPVVLSLLRAPRSQDLSGTGLESSGNSGGAGIEPAMLIFRREPIYPVAAKKQLVSGKVELHFRISPAGEVHGVKSVKGPPILAQAAIAAVRGWRYEPARLNGAPIDSAAQAEFTFNPD